MSQQNVETVRHYYPAQNAAFNGHRYLPLLLLRSATPLTGADGG